MDKVWGLAPENTSEGGGAGIVTTFPINILFPCYRALPEEEEETSGDSRYFTSLISSNSGNLHRFSSKPPPHIAVLWPWSSWTRHGLQVITACTSGTPPERNGEPPRSHLLGWSLAPWRRLKRNQ
ncbi:hypothetical protein VULLAG_LOCUS15766 [Vulpes lagopus]